MKLKKIAATIVKGGIIMKQYELKMLNGELYQLLGIVEDPKFVDGIMTATKVGDRAHFKCSPIEIKVAVGYFLEEYTGCLAERKQIKQFVGQKRPFRS